MSKTQINSDAALFLLGQAVWIITGKGFNQGTLAMIDVASSRKDGVAGLH